MVHRSRRRSILDLSDFFPGDSVTIAVRRENGNRMPNQELLMQSAIDFCSSRFPIGDIIAAAACTKSGLILTGVWCDARVDSAALCAETGPICQAHALEDPITSSICIARDFTGGGYRVLPACGVCQERLAFWGLDVLIAVPGRKYGGICDFLTLRELRPYYWDEVRIED